MLEIPEELPLNVVLWIAAGLLALAMLGSGIMKAVRPKAALRESIAANPGSQRLVADFLFLETTAR